MRLDRNEPREQKRGKYALIKLREDQPRKLPGDEQRLEVAANAVDYGTNENDFFVIRLKDKYAAPALRAYADAARFDDPEYAADIDELARLAETHPNKRKPD